MLTEVLPLPSWDRSEVAIEPPEQRQGVWVGGPSAVWADGSIWLAYRVRRPIGAGRGIANVVARSSDGVTFTPVAELTKEWFDAASLERPALVRTGDGRWRLYVSAATHGSKHWRIDVVEADDPTCLATALPRTVLPGGEDVGVKDPVVLRTADGRWHMWVCCHPLDPPQHADRMFTSYATSDDGVRWDWHGPVLHGRDGRWDARGVRVTSVVMGDSTVLASYDGRASVEENWEERTGLAQGAVSAGLAGTLSSNGDRPVGSPYEPGGLRYLSLVRLPDGRTRLYYEATRADGAHELRTELVDGTTGPLADAAEGGRIPMNS